MEGASPCAASLCSGGSCLLRTVRVYPSRQSRARRACRRTRPLALAQTGSRQSTACIQSYCGRLFRACLDNGRGTLLIRDFVYP